MLGRIRWRVMADVGLGSGSDGLLIGGDGVARCWWAELAPAARVYHDQDWGIPVGDDAGLFEKLSFQVFQGGMSWLMILRKWDAFQRAFADFDVERVAGFGERDVTRLLGDAGIVRSRGKIETVIHNAGRAVDLIDAEGSLGLHLWSFQPKDWARPRDRAEFEGRTATTESTALARDLKKRGWRFVGPASMHLFMQAAGIVNSHVVGCHGCRGAGS